MQLAVYLDYLHTEIQIQRLLERQTQRENPALMEIAAQLLSSFMTLAKQRDRTSDVNRDFSWGVNIPRGFILIIPNPNTILQIFIYGLPSAGVLARFLQRYTRLDRTFPTSISRADLIRNLSEFVSCLEWVARSGEGNHIPCDRAGKILTRLLAEVLNGGRGSANDRLDAGNDTYLAFSADADMLPSPNSGAVLNECISAFGGGEDMWAWCDGMNVDWSSLLGEEHGSLTF